MRYNKLREVLEKQISLITPEDIGKIKKEADEFVRELEKEIKRKKIKAEIFIGGSLAKNTIIKKDKYDIDIFARFDKKYKNISEILGKITKNKNTKKIHGSRDYFQIKKGGILFEIIPVLKISKPEHAENVTDLSFFHVNYIKNQIKKKKKLAQEIMLAKSFCYAQNCYGAESYIRGFSGYALELLICHYGGFIDFLKGTKDKKTIVIPGKSYKKQNIMLELNEAKLQSPIIFIDPTFKERNVLAALSGETFERFQKISRDFLKNPSRRFFERRSAEKEMRKYKNLAIIKAGTNRQKGDVAGSKLRRFYDFITRKLERYFDIKKKEFEYLEDENTGKMYFILKKKNKIIVNGPPISSLENVHRFRKKHKNSFVRGKKFYAKLKPVSFSKFLEDFKKNEKIVMKEMGIRAIRLQLLAINSQNLR